MSEPKKKTARSAGTSSAASKAKKKAASARQKEEILRQSRLHDEIWSMIFIACGVFLAIAVQTSAAGIIGAAIKSFLMGMFGIVAYILPYYLIVYGILLFARQAAHIGLRSGICLALIFLMASVINSAFCIQETDTFGLGFLAESFAAGKLGESAGAFGMLIGFGLTKIVGKTGLWIFCSVIILVCALLLINTPISAFFDSLKTRRELLRTQREQAEEILQEEALQQEEAMQEPPAKKQRSAAGKGKKQRETAEEQVQEPLGIASEPVILLDDSQAEPPQLRPRPGKRPGQRPGTISKGQMKILDYMKDDTLFESRGVSDGLGIEEPSPVEPGKGLTPVGLVEDAPVSFGLPPEEEEAFDAPEGEAAEKAALNTGLAEDAAPAEKAEITSAPKPPLFAETAEKDGTAWHPEAAPLPKAQPKAEDIPAAAESKPKPKPYQPPAIDLLNRPNRGNNSGEKADLQAKAQKLEETLHNFNVNARVLQVTRGPAVTRYEIQPSTGVKVNSIVRLADDIALNLEAKSIRIEAPIPGKAAVGIEVENEKINMVTIREIVDSKEFKEAKSKISFAVGKDIAGKCIVADLKSMPHLLIAGSTGSGKSVCINSLIISILYHATPEEVKFVLIDPKVVELSNYNGIPHLLIPVVTEPSKASAALSWAVAEMNDRYKKFAQEGVRDLASYNETVKGRGEDDKFMPQIVIIIDELADLMLASPAQVEESISRLAALARAAGMHLVVATQRPSVDVITGVIKANIPSRIAFAVSSQFDSRTILDMAGAEKLVGKGDMLFNPLGMAKPTRVQGCFISDQEVHNVIEHLKPMAVETEYAADVLHSIERAQSEPGHQEEETDELLAEAIETVVRAEQASVSMLQRRFRIGYNRAARLVDMMEARGIIGAADGSRPRKVLVSVAELEAMGQQAEEAEGEEA